MKHLILLLLTGSCLALPAPSRAADFQAGVARVDITPPVPFWLSGYGARTNPAPKVRSTLWAKALALRDPTGASAVLVTTDLIGLPAEISEVAAARLARQYRLPRAAMVFNASHTHAGPAIWPNLRVIFDFPPAEQERVRRYAEQLTERLVRVAGEALDRLAPAQLAFGQGTAGFAVNRRQVTPAGIRIGVQPDGPVDHTVPVLRVSGPDGSLRAVLFGYACHNTTLGGDFYEVDGDYAGAAQRRLEETHSGATALFLMLCGGDQNPNPRGRVEHVEQHGRELAEAVTRTLAGPLAPVRPPLRCAHQIVSLEFAPHTRATFEAELREGNVFRQRRARLMLDAYDRGQPVRHLAYPVQALGIGGDFTLLALGGEVVIDYARRVAREFPRPGLVVAGYCNDVPCYIPSRRVLEEGGYEAVDSMIYYGQPGPFAPDVEERVFSAIRDVLGRLERTP